MANKKQKANELEVINFDTQTLWTLITAHIGQSGEYKVSSLAAEALKDVKGVSTEAKENLLRRAYEWKIKQQQGEPHPERISIYRISGKLLTPPPKGVKPIEDVILFDPDKK